MEVNQSSESDFEPPAKKGKPSPEETDDEEGEQEGGTLQKKGKVEKKVLCPECGKELYKRNLQNHTVSRNCRKEDLQVSDFSQYIKRSQSFISLVTFFAVGIKF